MSAFDKGTVVISIDDGRKDAYRLFKEILEPLGLAATFNIVTDWMGDYTRTEGWALNRAELEEIAKSPLAEIACHGNTHKNTEEDIVKGKDLICEWLGTNGKIGFASPGSGMKEDFVLQNADRLSNMGFLYIRSTDGAAATNENHTHAIAKAKEKGWEKYVVENIQRFSYGFDNMFVNSAVVKFETKVKHLKQLTELAIEEKALVLFMFHSVKKPGEPAYDDTYSYDYDKFKEIANYWSELKKEGKLEILTNKDAFIKGFLRR